MGNLCGHRTPENNVRVFSPHRVETQPTPSPALTRPPALPLRSQHFRWAGCDTFCTTTAEGKRSVVVSCSPLFLNAVASRQRCTRRDGVCCPPFSLLAPQVIETNSCPSGQKHMPLLEE